LAAYKRTLLVQLRLRWGPIPAETEQAILTSQDADQLMQWLLNTVHAANLDAVGIDAVRVHEVQLLRLMLDKLSAIEGVRVFGVRDLEARSGVLSFNVGDIHPHDLSTVLDQDGVCIRAGHHCAQPLMRRLGVPATSRASATDRTSVWWSLMAVKPRTSAAETAWRTLVGVS